ncbi:MAG: hypothetical protein DHS80DRAFT_28838 [Piptocephalis tieghemiana]|nr:MAG: hypothetical protein DHS80DRAFT_28838 [Piptocephalis tieghemiana]
MADGKEELFEDDFDLENAGPFESTAEELAFFKERAFSLREALLRSQDDFRQYQTDSRDYEDELEKNISLLEEQVKELRSAVNVLQLESSHWKDKYQDDKRDAATQQETLLREIEFLRTASQKYKDQTRELEQDNDDLERNGRVAACSLKDVELRLVQAQERNAFLETELEIKNKLVIVVQRLKDELRDLQLEVSVLRSKRTSGSFKRRSVGGEGRDSTSSASGGVDPVRMVQDMLGRVKSLEGRLQSCRGLVTPMLAPPPSYHRASGAATPGSIGGGGPSSKKVGAPPSRSRTHSTSSSVSRLEGSGALGSTRKIMSPSSSISSASMRATGSGIPTSPGFKDARTRERRSQSVRLAELQRRASGKVIQ